MASLISETLLSRVVGTIVLLIGAIHLAPISGVLGSRQLEALYGINVAQDPTLKLLMRHRAVLFGLLGAALVCMALRPAFHGAALLLATISVASFPWLAATDRDLITAATHRVVRIDQLAAVLLGLAIAAQLWKTLRS